MTPRRPSIAIAVANAITSVNSVATSAVTEPTVIVPRRPTVSTSVVAVPTVAVSKRPSITIESPIKRRNCPSRLSQVSQVC